LPDVLFEFDLSGRYQQYHTSRANLLAAPPEVFSGKLLAEVLPEKASTICLDALQEAHAKGLSTGRQIELPFAEGPRWFELSVARKESADARDPRFIMISRDITERKQAENHLLLVGQVFKSSHEGIFITDANNRILSANQAFCTITGYLESELVGQDPRILRSGRQDRAFYVAMWREIQHTGNWEGEIWNQRKNGQIYPEWLSISAVKDTDGHIFQYIGILRDLTDSKAAQEQIEFLANYDPLTQLPNHKLLQDRTRLALATAKRTGTQVVMMFVDIDRFQSINDSLGRPVGDQILQTLATRLTANLQSDDTVCRQGSDEFVLLLPNTHANAAAHVASRLLALIQEPVPLDAGNEVSLTACIGIAIFPDNGSDFQTLSQCADAALLQAKRDGRDSFKFFTEQIQTDAKESLLVESHLRRALSRGEFVLYYQPQVDALSQQIIGAEALIRWQHPEWGLVSPARFISIAETSGQILAIGNWVMHTAAQQIAAWQRDGLPLVPVAVNLSALQFHQTGLCESVAAVLADSGLKPELLELELTESVAMEDSRFTLDQIGKLHAMGLKLSIDDFGTGYSSLSYLKRYQIDKLKIDQSFVRDLDLEQDDGAIVRAIVQMAHGLGFKTIAEGVETQHQIDFLRAQGCDELQGYFFGRPMPAEAFAQLLRTSN
ncbi:MAG: EAL domain-containing protein, partial [Rhodoferax sp.]|nr:EAL domain-containing protein [Rhodoferax sp.]